MRMEKDEVAEEEELRCTLYLWRAASSRRCPTTASLFRWQTSQRTSRFTASGRKYHGGWAP